MYIFGAANMRIAVNTRLLLKGKIEGIGWFTYQTLQRMVRTHPEHEFFFLFDRPCDPMFVFAPNVTPVVVHPQARHPVLYYIWFEWSLPAVLKKYNIDLFLSTDGFTTLSSNVPCCLVMHDLAFEHYPEHITLLHRLYLRHYSPLFARKAKRLVTVSNFSKDDIVKQYGVSADIIDVVYNGAHDAYRPLTDKERQAAKNKYAAGCEYFVFAGAMQPRKNIVRMLKAFIEFKQRQPSNMKLVIVGRFAWKNEGVKQMQREMPFRDEVNWVGYLDVEELSHAMGGAYALVFVSLFEGFGIPILEAMQCDVPAIVSNTSSIPEVAGEAALYVDPTDVADIAAKMHLICKDETLRARLVANARIQHRKFDWDASAKKLWDCMMKCVG